MASLIRCDCAASDCMLISSDCLQWHPSSGVAVLPLIACRLPLIASNGIPHQVWLRCLDRAGLLCETDRAAAALVVFDKYLALMRRLQTTYWLEPAGSHGVWGLDDYQFLPFILGAAQLTTQHALQPTAVHDAEVSRPVSS